ncbi:hypothetical protein GCM10009682_41340 [Luedemannella flava]|uniref:CopG-like ribbon-helix-helix domain-containing protein n=1 Tax=Luedemannella flava TaxID=349316 RepID=A0ABP4YJT2_9ACTN
MTITLPDDLADALAAEARSTGIPVSRLIASAAESELRRRIGRQVVREWEAEHGSFTPEELAAVRAELAAADAEALDPSRSSAA